MRKFKKKLTWIFLIALFSIAVAGVAINGAYSHAGKSSPVNEKQTQGPRRTRLSVDFLATEQRPQPSTLMALPIALRTNGFLPDEITRPAGNFLISVTNLTGLPDIAVRLDRETGASLHTAKVPKEKHTWRQHVHLSPGNYVLTVVDHPEWSCRITITAQ
jgi:hypothetical protein